MSLANHEKHNVKRGDIYEWHSDPMFRWEVIDETPNQNGFYKSRCLNSVGEWHKGELATWLYEFENWKKVL